MLLEPGCLPPVYLRQAVGDVHTAQEAGGWVVLREGRHLGKVVMVGKVYCGQAATSPLPR